MIVYLSCPYVGYYRGEIGHFKDAASAYLKARGDTLIWDPVNDRSTMACRNNQVNRFRSTPADIFVTLDSDALPTRDDQPDVKGLALLLEDLAHEEIDVVFGWSLIARPAQGDLVPCVMGAKGSDPRFPPDEWPIDFVAPYASEPLTELQGGACGTHVMAAKREVFDAMNACGRLYFEDVHERNPESPNFGGRIQGHDVTFCQYAQDLGYRVWMDNRVFWGHDKNVDLRWVHDIVRDQALRLNAHESVAALLYPNQPPWITLRQAEEEARGRKVICLSDEAQDILKDGTLSAGMRYDIAEGGRTFIFHATSGRCVDLFYEALGGRIPESIEHVGEGVVVRL